MLETLFVTTMFLAQMATHERPEVKIRTPAEMCELSGKPSTCSDPNRGSFSHKDPYIINLRNDTDLTTLYGKGVLVHEIVHFLQLHTGKASIPLRCPEYYFLEREALMIQTEYYAHNGYVYQALPAMLEAYATKCWRVEK